MDFEQPIPSSYGSVNDEDESAVSSTLFFEKDDVILVVDDNADMRGYIRKIFSPYLTVLEAQDGCEALQIARSQKLHMVLCDVMMPKMDGPELVKQLRKERKTKFLPVIFVTAADDGDQLDTESLFGGKEEGAVDCISKPFRVRDILARIHLQLQLGKRRVKLEDEFEARSYELQVLGELSPVGIFRTDADGKITYVNPAWYQITGFSQERERDEWLDHLQPGSKEDAIRIWRGCFENCQSAAVRVLWKNDVWTHVVIAPLISTDGAVVGAFGAIMDINEQYRLEAARIALAEEREHIAASRAEDAETQRQLEVERRRAQARIANDILSLSRIQLNVLPVVPTDFDIRRETSQILMVFRNELMAKKIDLKLDLGRGVDIFGLQIISTDRSRFAQIITNLMSNAIRFTDTSTGLREIKVSLELSPDPPIDDSCAVPPFLPEQALRAHSPGAETGDPAVYVYVSVQDSGPGLQKEDLALLFQRFQQGSNAHHVFGGSGLGLFVCRQLCNLMGGRIEVVSEPGEGAMFRFFIRAAAPAYRPPPPPAGLKPRRSLSNQSRTSHISKRSASASRPLPETPNIHHDRPLHVLITEDNKINQTVLARQMKRAGFTTVLASNGLEAIQAIDKAQPQGAAESRSETFDVVLMDLEMPVLDGFAATREIRRRESLGTLRTHNFIIALTGNARLEQ
ncbi:hypothetical protein FRC11_009064, partial [Ceratobasidium sp. 423]